jgi:hypothetical protein
LRDRETSEEQLRRKQLDAQRKTDIRERGTIERLKGSISTNNVVVLELYNPISRKMRKKSFEKNAIEV